MLAAFAGSLARAAAFAISIPMVLVVLGTDALARRCGISFGVRVLVAPGTLFHVGAWTFGTAFLLTFGATLITSFPYQQYADFAKETAFRVVSNVTSRFQTPIDVMAESSIDDQIRSTARYYGVPPRFALAVAEWETGRSQYTLAGDVKRSSSGAVGIFQLKESTAADLGVNPYITSENIIGGVRYLRYLMDQFPAKELRTMSVPPQLAKEFQTDPLMTMTLAAYHAGVGRVKRANGIPSKPGGEWNSVLWAETVRYVKGVFALANRF